MNDVNKMKERVSECASANVRLALEACGIDADSSGLAPDDARMALEAIRAMFERASIVIEDHSLPHDDPDLFLDAVADEIMRIADAIASSSGVEALDLA